MARHASRSRRQRSRRRWGLKLLLATAVLATGYLVWLDLTVRTQFEGRRWALPARIYARPLELYEGMALGPAALRQELEAVGYREGKELERPGSFRRRGPVTEVHTRDFRFWDGVEPGRSLKVRFAGGRIKALHAGGARAAIVRLEPRLVGRIYPGHHEDRVLVRLGDVDPLLVGALLAAEDREFHRHLGISPRGIARALLANIRAGATVQGGSTITQQLAKNFFLSSDRTLVRKLNEAALALLLELRYDKQEILEAYLNEVFLGQDGRRAVHGFGLGARFWFGRPLDELSLPEIALMVGLVRGPSYYNPRRHPERALERRALILSQMAEQGVITKAQAQAAADRPVGIAPAAPGSSNRHPAFVELVRRQLRRDYHEADLRSEGLRVFTTLDPHTQARAEETLKKEVHALERGRSGNPGQLQGAVVVSSSDTGEVLALVGGRDPRASGFNRALDAERPVGSLIKPAVYLTALERPGRYNLLTPLDDGPLRLRDARGEVWAPRNYDGKHHGRVPLYTALARSYNVATVRLGLDLGIEEVLETLARLGVERPVPAYPAVLLGAVSLTPMEVAQMYQSIASGGFRVPLRAIQEVTDSEGRALNRYRLSVEQVADPAPVYLLTRAMEEVMRSGTGRGAYKRVDRSVALAGKTGSTSGLRDSWFAGFGEDRVAVVWMGLDDNTPVGLTGASGALRVWSTLMANLETTPLDPAVPASVVWRWADPVTGRLSGEGCPGALRTPFVATALPPAGDCTASAGIGTRAFAWEPREDGQ